ncbi:unnamed protein product [Penicillium pancosmium]
MADPTHPQTTTTNMTTNPAQESNDNQKKEALAAFTATLHSVGTNLEAPLRDRATTITSNAAALQRQETELAETTARLARQNAQWAGLADETRDGLKEIGDVQNWAEMIERDLLVLEDMMDDVEGHGGGELEGGWGSVSGEDSGMEVDGPGVGVGNGNGNGDRCGLGPVEVEAEGENLNGVVNGDSNGNLKKKPEVRKGSGYDDI